MLTILDKTINLLEKKRKAISGKIQQQNTQVQRQTQAILQSEIEQRKQEIREIRELNTPTKERNHYF